MNLITDHIDTWTSAIKAKSSAGRGGGKKQEFYGIKKLRELILELAVRGLLVPQDAEDEPASELLKKIAGEKSKLIKTGKIKKGKKFALADEELPFEIPSIWTWTTLGEISEIGPRNTLPDDINAGSVPMPLISNSYDGSHGQEIKKWGEIKKGYTHFANGDIAIAKITPCFENSKAAIFKGLESGYGAGTTELHVARLIGKFVIPRFILLYLKAPMFLEKGKAKMTGSAGQKRIPSSFFSGNPLPLPPLAEQQRIVAKVDELMALCDQLEQQQEDSVRTHAALVETLLGALTAASERGDFAEAWQRIASHFDTLFTTESSIAQLKQTILQLAVMGKLVEQDPEDEDASALIRRVSKSLPDKKSENPFLSEIDPLITNETEYELPEGWAWIPLGHIGIWATGCGFPTKYQGEEDREFLFCKVSDMNLPGNEVEIHRTVHTIDSEVLKKIRARPNPVGTVIFPKIGGAIATHKRRIVIKPTIIDNNCSGIQPIGLTDNRWLLLLMRSLDLTEYQSGTSVPAVSQSSLNPIRVGLPPLAEQHRIVAKVNELMALCDRLKERLQSAQTTQFHLADTLVEAAIH